MHLAIGKYFFFLFAFVCTIGAPLRVHADTLPNPLLLNDNVTGGDCVLVGTWNPDTKTCTLQRDISVSVQIQNAGITLNGGGYAIIGNGTGTGLGIHGVRDVVITNGTVEGFAAGMQAYGVENLLVDHVTFRNNEYIGLANFIGITFTDSTFISSPLNSRSRSYDLTFAHNTFDRGGLFLNGTYEITITDNIFGIMGSVYVGESDGCASTTISNNTLENGNISLRWSSGENAITNNTVTGEIVSTETGDLVITDNHVNLATGGDWLIGLRVYDHIYSSLLVKGNTVAGCSGRESQCINYGLYRVAGGDISDNSAEGGKIGFELFNTAGLTLSHNTTNGASIAGVFIQNQNNYYPSYGFGPNIFTANIFRDGALGIKTDVPLGLLGSNIFFKNSFIANTQDTNIYYPSTRFTFSQPLPDGGNYWDKYDTPGEGCMDANNDERCDAPYHVPNVPGYALLDEYPWIGADAWDGSHTKSALTLPPDAPYNGTQGVDKTKGIAQKDIFTFRVIYTDVENRAPENIHVVISSSDDSNTLALFPDMLTASSTLKDGMYSNGELYSATSTFPKKIYTYHFTARPAGGTEKRLPASGDMVFQAGYSSIIFLPGIKGSRLIDENVGIDDELWLPLNGADVRALAMDTNGNSIKQDIYVGDVIDVAYPHTPWPAVIYEPFLNFGKNLTSATLIKDFEEFPYDWRYDVRDAVNNPILKEEGTSYNMYDRLLAIARDSDSGKVIIIGHSNGGLVGKALIAKLTEAGKGSLVEKFVMVGVPQLGTPDAIVPILHGRNQEPTDLVSASSFRFASHFMPGAYGLFPLGTYNTAASPPISFDDSALTALYRNAYGSTINTQTELKNFFNGVEGRVEPDEDSLNEPIKLNAILVEKAQATHTFLESWTPPEGVEVIEFAGGNLPTINKVEYKQKADCFGTAKSCLLVDPKPYGTGDGTVVLESAQAQVGAQGYVIDMWESRNWEHYNMLNNPELQHMLEELITTYHPSLGNWIYPKGTALPAQDFIALQTFSPVIFEITDSAGNKIKREKLPDGDLEIVHKEIPRGQYFRVGEMQMVLLPADQEYAVRLSGTATGTLQLEMEEYRGGMLIKERAHPNIPVTDKLTSTFTLTHIVDMGVINIDTNGDGKNDVALAPKTPERILKDLHTYLSSLKILPLSKVFLLAEVAKIERNIQKGNSKVALKTIALMKLTIRVDVRFKILTTKQKAVIMEYLTELENLIKGK